MYTCVYAYIYIYTYIYIYIHMSICMCVYIYIYTYMSVWPFVILRIVRPRESLSQNSEITALRN